MITYPKICKTCRMELLPHMNKNGVVVVSKNYCDEICEDFGKNFFKMFSYAQLQDETIRTEYGIIQRVDSVS